MAGGVGATIGGGAAGGCIPGAMMTGYFLACQAKTPSSITAVCLYPRFRSASTT